jgi:cytochrome c-type biogenesis protein CcmH
MKSLRWLLAVWLAFAAGAVVTAAEEGFDDPVLEARYQALTHEIRCPKCLNESIAESKAPVAADLRREVRRLIGEARRTRADVSSERYGDFVVSSAHDADDVRSLGGAVRVAGSRRTRLLANPRG